MDFAVPASLAPVLERIASDTVLAHYYVHERGARIYDGPDEVHKMVVAAAFSSGRGGQGPVGDDRGGGGGGGGEARPPRPGEELAAGP